MSFSYAFYRDSYHGTLTEAELQRAEVPARAYLGRITCGRAAFEDEREKLALCAVCDAVALEQQGGGLAAETNDGVSVTYALPRTGGSAARYRAAADFLAGTGLLYRGVEPG